MPEESGNGKFRRKRTAIYYIRQDAIFGLGNTLPDGFTAATPLGQLAQGSMPSASLCDSIIGFIPGCSLSPRRAIPLHGLAPSRASG